MTAAAVTDATVASGSAVRGAKVLARLDKDASSPDAPLWAYLIQVA